MHIKDRTWNFRISSIILEIRAKCGRYRLALIRKRMYRFMNDENY